LGLELCFEVKLQRNGLQQADAGWYGYRIGSEVFYCMDPLKHELFAVHPRTLEREIQGRQSQPNLSLENVPPAKQSWQDWFPDYKNWLDRCSPQEVLEIFKAARELMTRLEKIPDKVKGGRLCSYDVTSDILIREAKEELDHLIKGSEKFINRLSAEGLGQGELLIKHLLDELDAKVYDFEKFRDLLFGEWTFEPPEANETSESCQPNEIIWSKVAILINKISILKSLINPGSGDETEDFIGD
jgi:hypothetical protein